VSIVKTKLSMMFYNNLIHIYCFYFRVYLSQ